MPRKPTATGRGSRPKTKSVLNHLQATPDIRGKLRDKMMKEKAIIDDYLAITSPERLERTRLIIFYGEVDSGKSLLARIRYQEAYHKHSGALWDGYDGQEVVLLDNFAGEKSGISLGTLKQLGDWTSLRVDKRRGATRRFKSRLVVVTTNVPLHKWYPDAYPVSIDGLINRIDAVFTFSKAVDSGSNIHCDFFGTNKGIFPPPLIMSADYAFDLNGAQKINLTDFDYLCDQYPYESEETLLEPSRPDINHLFVHLNAQPLRSTEMPDFFTEIAYKNSK